MRVIQLPLTVTPLEHARKQLWHFERRAWHLRALGFTRAANAAQAQAAAWYRRIMELVRQRRRSWPSRRALGGRYEQQRSYGMSGTPMTTSFASGQAGSYQQAERAILAGGAFTVPAAQAAATRLEQQLQQRPEAIEQLAGQVLDAQHLALVRERLAYWRAICRSLAASPGRLAGVGNDGTDWKRA
jgi:hypothetical protein